MSDDKDMAPAVALAVAQMEKHILEQMTATRDDTRKLIDSVRDEVRDLFRQSEAQAAAATQVAKDVSFRVDTLRERMAKNESLADANHRDIDSLATAIRDTQQRNQGRLDVVRVIQAVIAGGSAVGVLKLFEVLLGT